MNAIATAAFFIVIGTLLLNLYLLFTRKPPASLAQAMKRWQASIIVFAVCLLFYIILYTTILNSIEFATMVYDETGALQATAMNNGYLYELSYLRIALGVTSLNLLLTIAMIVYEFRFFGRAKFNKDAWRYRY